MYSLLFFEVFFLPIPDLKDTPLEPQIIIPTQQEWIFPSLLLNPLQTFPSYSTVTPLYNYLVATQRGGRLQYGNAADRDLGHALY